MIIQFKTKFLNLLILTVLLLTLTSCFDLNNFKIDTTADTKDYKAYYTGYFETFGDEVSMVKQDKTKKKYNLCDSFFNYTITDKLAWEKEEYEVVFDEYIYMSIPVEKDFKMDSLALYIKLDPDSADTSSTLELYFYISDNELGTNVPSFTDEIREKDGDNFIKDEFDKFVYKVFDLKNKDTAIAKKTVTINKNTWSSFVFDDFNNNDVIDVSSGKYLVISFYNNTGYANFEYDPPLKKVSFQITNLLIRSE